MPQDQQGYGAVTDVPSGTVIGIAVEKISSGGSGIESGLKNGLKEDCFL